MLGITDAVWLMVESRDAPQHVAGLMIFTYPEGQDDRWLTTLWERLRTVTDLEPPFSYRLARPYGRWWTYSWREDEAIDLDYHLRLSALPTPARVRELFVLVSRLHSIPLDRNRPLWEVHLIGGVEPDHDDPDQLPRFAMYIKFHHSVFDGVGAMRIMRRLVSGDPAARDMAPPWGISSEPTPRPPRPADSQEQRTPPQGVFEVTSRIIVVLFRQVFAWLRRVKGEAIPFAAPRTPFNGRITGARRVAADGWSLSRIQRVAKVLDVSVNDVALAMSSHALRHYLEGLDGVPKRPMTAMVPVSIRDIDQHARGTELSFIVADLGTNLADPAARLARICASMARGKERLAGLSRTERIAYAVAIASPYLLGPLFGIAGRGRPVATIVISNVPGPSETQYFDGARLRGVYPVSLLQQGQGLNITFASYGDELQFGLTASKRTLPHVQRMLGHMEDGLLELEALADAAG